MNNYGAVSPALMQLPFEATVASPCKCRARKTERGVGMDLEHTAIMRLQEAAKLSKFYYEKPLLLTYSGGKDSEVCLELCRRARAPFLGNPSFTTAEAPATV